MARDLETRAATSRDAGANAFGSHRDLAADMVPDGMEVLWMNETVRGERQEDNIDKRLNEDGYTPITTHQMPSFANRRTLDGTPPRDELIRKGGQVLVGRPTERGEQARAEQIALAQQAEYEAVHGASIGDDPRLMRGDPKARTRVTRERGRPQFEE